MFIFTKKSHPTTILITSHRAITNNQLTVDDLWQERHAASNLAHVLGQAITKTDDPLDNALTHYLTARAMTVVSHQPLREFHFDHKAGTSGTIWHHGAEYQLAIKGMPERILEHCDMSENEREVVMMQLHAMSRAGSYVIALATGIVGRPIKKVSDLTKNEKLSFVGLVSVKIGIASAARQCVNTAKEKGITVYFASGTHPVAAYYLANQLGMASQPSDVSDARHLDTSNTAGLLMTIRGTKIFARANDTQKVAILNSLKAIDKTAVSVETLDDFKKLLAN
jgi:Ca2+-transporting ATPase